ncbi:MAG: TonB-dependent receptor [Crocinitomicaceae bacterium]
MKLFNLYIVLFFICSTNYVKGQLDSCNYSISGIIKSTDNETLKYATVSLNGTGFSTRTNGIGKFEFSNMCNGEYVLICKHFDHIIIQDTIIVNKNWSKNYQFNENNITLPSIEIYADQSEKQTTNVDKIDKDKIDKVKGLPLGTMLEEINGVRSLKTGNSISKPIIRGLHSNRVLILNNGIRQEGQQWGAEHAPEIDPFVTNSISLIKGANSIKYGFDAIGGVVLIEPRKVTDSIGIFGEVNLIGFSNGRQGMFSSSLEGRHKLMSSLAWSVQGTYKVGGNTHAPNYFLKNTGIREYNFSGNLVWEKKNYGLDFYYSQFNTNLGIFSGSHIGNLTDLQNAFDLQEPAEKADFSYTIQRPWQHIEHELTKTKFFLRTGNIGKLNLVYARQYNLRYEYDKHGPLNDSLANLNNPELQLELTTHTVDLNWQHYKVMGLEGEIGMSGIYQGNTFSGRKFIPNYQNQGIGFYWIEKKKFKKFLLEAGLRYDFRYLQVFMRENDVIVSPSHTFQDFAGNIGLSYQVNKDLKFFANVSKTWRPPTVSELYSNGIHHGAAAVEIGNERLLQENALSSNIEMIYMLKRMKFEVSPYFNYFSNYIFLEPQLPPTLTIKGAFPTFVYKEAEVRIAGLDFLSEIRLTKNLTYTLKGSVLRAFNITASDYLIQMPADYFQNKINFQFPKIGRLIENNLALKYTHVTRQVRVPANSDYVPPPSSYNLFDLEMATKVLVKNQLISIHFGVNNLLNTAYRDYLNRFRYYTDEMGRNFTLRVKIPLSI